MSLDFKPRSEIECLVMLLGSEPFFNFCEKNLAVINVKNLIYRKFLKKLLIITKTLTNTRSWSSLRKSKKTFLSMAFALSSLEKNEVDRIILCRPAVEAGESLGFLPGDLKEKVDPYLSPLYDALDTLMPKNKLNVLIENKNIEIVPLAYMRGRTLDNAFMILDEAQNSTVMQMKMFLTRLGMGSKAVINGDITQIDLSGNKFSGLIQAEKILKGVDGIGFTYFNDLDIVRHPLVKKIISAYDSSEKKRGN